MWAGGSGLRWSQINNKAERKAGKVGDKTRCFVATKENSPAKRKRTDSVT